jgi:hypothetical protein
MKALAGCVVAREEREKVVTNASLEWVAYIMVAEGQDNEGGKQTEANYSKLLADIEQAADKVWQDIDQLADQLANVDAVQRPAVCAILADRLGNVLVKRAKTVPVNGDKEEGARIPSKVPPQDRSEQVSEIAPTAQPRRTAGSLMVDGVTVKPGYTCKYNGIGCKGTQVWGGKGRRLPGADGRRKDGWSRPRSGSRPAVCR